LADIASIKRQLGERGFLRFMAPPLTHEELCAIEATYGVALPPDYRAFLQEIGNGGPGPHYGLLPFDKALDYDNRLWGEATPVSHLAAPFPHTAMFNPAPAQELAGERVDRGEITDDEFGRIVHSATQGTLGLAHHGCAYYDVLVVTGPTRGTVWHDASDTRQGFHPMGIGFLDWYQSWLDGKYPTMWTPADVREERRSIMDRLFGLRRTV